PDSATGALLNLSTSSPWLAFGGIPAPFAGVFNSTGSLGAILDPNSPSLGQAFPLLPANLKPPVPVTNLAQYGYALDTKTSPPSLLPSSPRHARPGHWPVRLGFNGRADADHALRRHVLGVQPGPRRRAAQPRRHGVVSPPPPHDRLRGGGGGERQPGTGRPRRSRHA